MIDVAIVVEDGVAGSLRSLSRQLRHRIYGPALLAAARIVRAKARQRDYVFRDGRGTRSSDRRLGRSVRLRSTIRAQRVRGRYGNESVARGRAAVYIGGRRARHGYLVQAGHGGPRGPAAPRPVLETALRDTTFGQQVAFVQAITPLIDKAMAAADRIGWQRRRVQSYGRAVARRGRRQ